MDAQQIHSLFDEQKSYKKYIKKDLVRVYGENNVVGATRIRFTCHTLTNKLIDYSDAFLLFRGIIDCDDAAHNIADGDTITLNNCAVFKDCKCSFNNNEVEHNRVPDLSTVWLNLLEYSPDYASSIATQYAFVKDVNRIHNAGSGARLDIIKHPVVNNELPVTVVIPLKYLFQFFRRLTFPIINQLIDFEFNLNDHNRSIIRTGVNPSHLEIQSVTLYAPEVVLPTEINSKFMKALESGKMVKSLHWDAAEYPLQNRQIVVGNFDELLGTNLVGIRKILCMIRDDPNLQTNVQTMSDRVISNFNFEIDSKDLFNMNVQTDQEAFRLLSECFNSQGKDVNTGSLIDFVYWQKLCRLYAFDVSRQEVFESDPGAIQTIRFRGTTDKAGQMFIILLKNKVTQIDMSNPSNTRTV